MVTMLLPFEVCQIVRQINFLDRLGLCMEAFFELQ